MNWVDGNILCCAIKKVNPEKSEMVDLLSAELSSACFGFGDHLNYAHRRNWSIIKELKRVISIKTRLKKMLVDQKKKSFRGNFVSYQGYFNTNALSDAFAEKGMTLCEVPWINGDEKTIFSKNNKLSKKLRTESVAGIIGEEIHELLKKLQNLIDDYYNSDRIAGLILPFDCYYIQRIAIKSARKNGIPSMVYLHGLPGVYSSVDNNQGDYLAVWGEAIRQEYIKRGVDGKKIIVVGHPQFSGMTSNKTQRFSFERVVVLTHSLPGGLATDEKNAPRRDGCMAYPWMVEGVLRKLGVTSALLRPHPGENKFWYKNVVNSEFYVFDRDPIEKSLSKATLVIGPSSTVWLNAHKAGVHYQVFEPVLENGKNVIGFDVVAPFNGSDTRLSAAKNSDELLHVLREKIVTDTGIFNNWAGEKHDVSKVLDLIRK